MKRDTKARVRAFIDVNRTDYVHPFVFPLFTEGQTMKRIVLSMPTPSRQISHDYVVLKKNV